MTRSLLFLIVFLFLSALPSSHAEAPAKEELEEAESDLRKSVRSFLDNGDIDGALRYLETEIETRGWTLSLVEPKLLIGEVLCKYKESCGDAASHIYATVDLRTEFIGPDSPEVAESLILWAEASFAAYGAGYAEARNGVDRALKILESRQLHHLPIYTKALTILGRSNNTQTAMFMSAEDSLRKAMEAAISASSFKAVEVARQETNLASYYLQKSEYGKAEPLFISALSRTDDSNEDAFPLQIESLLGLNSLYRILGEKEAADRLITRAQTLLQNRGRISSTQDLISRLALARGLISLGDYRSAQKIARDCIAYAEKLETNSDLELGESYWTLGLALTHIGPLEDAQLSFWTADELVRRVISQDHPFVAQISFDWAALLAKHGYHHQSGARLESVIAIRERLFGRQHPLTASTLVAMGVSLLGENDLENGEAYLTEAAEALSVYIGRRAYSTSADRQLGRQEQAYIEANALAFEAQVKSLFRMVPLAPHKKREFEEDAFIAAQANANTEASLALAQFAQRIRQDSQITRDVLRELQDTQSELDDLDFRYLTALSTSPEERNQKVLDDVLIQRTNIGIRMEQLSSRLRDSLPLQTHDSQDLRFSIADVQRRLNRDEAVLLYFDTAALVDMPSETYAWLIGPNDYKMLKLIEPPEVLAERTSRLLDHIGTGSGTRGVTPLESDSTQLSLLVHASSDLYRIILEPVLSGSEAKELIIVPSPSLAKVPFQALVTHIDPAADVDFASIRWLIRDYAVSVRPSIFAFVSLREAGAVKTGNGYLGIGDPDFSGTASEGGSMPACATAPDATRRRKISADGLERYYSRGRVDRLALSSLAPLPESLSEVCQVGKSLANEIDKRILAGQLASEAALKEKNERGELSDFGVLHFATHALISGEIGPGTEPAIVLAQPKTSNEQSDGLLTASEIARLELDADWIILSACNTGAGDASNTEPYSGLARAFFYAGARSLLVTQWPIFSDAAVDLTTGTFDEMSRNVTISKSEALRRATVSVIDRGGLMSEPIYWAPFVLIGESARFR